MDVLELHAYIPPIQIQLEDTCYREALHLLSLPKAHPLYSFIKSSARQQPCSHPSPIHNLFCHFQIKPSEIEEINPIHWHPGWQPEFTSHIAADKNSAAQLICTCIDDLQLFSDGSGFESNIGAAAITTTPWNNLQYLLGDEDSHTVFEGEVAGILLALQLIDKSPKSTSVLIALDNQAAIRALEKNNPLPSQEAAQGIISAPERLPRVFHQDLAISTSALKAECKKSIPSCWLA